MLGALEVLDDGRPVALRAGRQALLLSCLLLHANELVSSDALVEALWPEQPPATAKNALQGHVHALRRRLGPERIVTEGPGYLIRVAPGELDAEGFERLVARGRGELASGEADAAAATLRDALALWRGPAFADVAYESFAQAEIARLDDLRLLALEERIEADLALARHLDVVSELEALVSAQPSRERLHGQLMLALYRSGRQTDALAAFRRARRVLRDELGLEPGPGLRQLQQAILRHDDALVVEPPEVRQRRHLPAAATALVGRRRELEEVTALLGTGGIRLVTLTGAGGSGKTRLALRVAHELAAAFRDGVFFVDLAPLRDPGLVPSAIAAALGLEERGSEQPGEALERHLRDLRLLLLLDNFEVVDEAAPLVGELLREAPQLGLLVTSRTPLRLAGEHEYRVSPLPLDDAVQLFAARARAVAPGFRRPSEEAEEVAAICRRLDCLPLAIELAAARTRDYGAAELLEALPSSLDLAGDGARDLPARQRTLRATIDWSYELLSADEQVSFARLAVFAGGCTEAAAAAVCGAGRGALASLVGKSLLVERLGAGGELRFSMLDTIRDYALELLAEDGEAQAVRRRHFDFFLALAVEARPYLLGAGQLEWLARVESERENVRAALDWALTAGSAELALQLAAALERFWWVRGPAEGLSWLERGLDTDGIGSTVRAAALEAAGATAWFVGDHARASRLFRQALTIFRRLRDGAGEARILNRLAPPLMVQGRFDEAEQVVRAALAANRELGDLGEVALSLQLLGASALERGDVGGSIELLEESAALARELGDLMVLIYDLANLAEAAIQQGDPARARTLGREALELVRELGDDVKLLDTLSVLALAASRDGDPRHAGLLWGAAERLSEELGATTWDRERRKYARLLGTPDVEFETGRTEGRASALEAIVELALAGGGDPSAGVRSPPDRPPLGDGAGLDGRAARA